MTALLLSVPERPSRYGGSATTRTHEGPAYVRIKAESGAERCTNVVLISRATAVPFTPVLNGPQRTTTDNHQAALTSAVRHPHR